VVLLDHGPLSLADFIDDAPQPLGLTGEWHQTEPAAMVLINSESPISVIRSLDLARESGRSPMKICVSVRKSQETISGLPGIRSTKCNGALFPGSS
jgi:hypothetical protein